MTDAFALGSFIGPEGVVWPGVVRGGRVAPLAALVPGAPRAMLDLFAEFDDWTARIAAALADAPEACWRDEAALTAAMPYLPDNILGAGANYRRHVIELIVDSGAGGTEGLSPADRLAFAEAEMDRRAASGKPFIWVGLRSALAAPGTPLVLPRDVVQPDWELELAVIIGRTARRVPAARALEHVAGYSIVNDITARELVNRPDLKALGMDWMACKSAPGFKVFGPYVTPARFVPDPQALRIRLSLNGTVMQDEGTDDMIFDVARLVEFASAHAELQPGDLLMTGSPAGNGTHYDRFLRPGDVMEGAINGLVGVQRVRCMAED